MQTSQLVTWRRTLVKQYIATQRDFLSALEADSANNPDDAFEGDEYKSMLCCLALFHTNCLKHLEQEL